MYYVKTKTQLIGNIAKSYLNYYKHREHSLQLDVMLVFFFYSFLKHDLFMYALGRIFYSSTDIDLLQLISELSGNILFITMINTTA